MAEFPEFLQCPATNGSFRLFNSYTPSGEIGLAYPILEGVFCFATKSEGSESTISVGKYYDRFGGFAGGMEVSRLLFFEKPRACRPKELPVSDGVRKDKEIKCTHPALPERVISAARIATRLTAREGGEPTSVTAALSPGRQTAWR